MSDHKESIKKALFKFLEKSEKERLDSHPNRSKKTKSNDDPEKRVEAACVKWLKANGFDGQVYESKAVLKDGEWRKAGMNFGHSDWAGVSPYGEACYIEFKAPGKRSTFWRMQTLTRKGNEAQQEFIIGKIGANAFAVVVDNVHDLERWYNCWRGARTGSVDLARKYLLDILPPKPKARAVDTRPLFD